MFIQNILDYFNSINRISDEEETELEIKILLDPRINLPDFIKNQSAITGDFKYIDTIKKIVTNSVNFGYSSISQTINFIHTEKNQMLVKKLHFKMAFKSKKKENFI